jgi:hypothetical protein
MDAGVRIAVIGMRRAIFDAMMAVKEKNEIALLKTSVSQDFCFS